MSRNTKMFKKAVVGIFLLVVAFLLLENVVFDPKKGFATRGNLELSWDVPSENADSSPLTDLAGYTIECWNSETRQTDTIDVRDPVTTSYRISHLRPGTYQCAMTALKGDGSQSALSNVVTRTVP